MDIRDFYYKDGEKPLDSLVTDGGFCGIFRRIACIGDSLSSGEFEGKTEQGQKTFHDMFDYSWGQYIARMAGTTVLNFSAGGMSAKEYLTKFAPQKGFFDTDKACQAYIIALGVNDVTQTVDGKIEFGELSDISFTNGCKDTFAGNYGKIIMKYKAIAPDAKFFLVTMPHCYENEKITPYNDKHRELLYGMTELFDNTYVIDLREYAPKYDAEFKRNFFLAGHMNAAGYLLTAKMIASYIDYIIRKNPDDFRQAGFIGTPYKNCEYKK